MGIAPFRAIIVNILIVYRLFAQADHLILIGAGMKFRSERIFAGPFGNEQLGIVAQGTQRLTQTGRCDASSSSPFCRGQMDNFHRLSTLLTAYLASRVP